MISEASAQEEEHVIEQALAERYCVLSSWMRRSGSSYALLHGGMTE